MTKSAAREGRGRFEVQVPSGSTYCSAWHYPGSNDACVILAGGAAVTKGPGTEKFAEKFNDAGFDVLAFEYRRLGNSGGQPRQIVNIREQLEDWQALIAYARALPGVDPQKVAIWGFSLSGGHVLQVAARTPDLGAVIAQAPNADGLDAFSHVFRHTRFTDGIRLVGLAIADAVGGLFGREPLLVPLAAPPGTTAFYTTPDSLNGQPTLNPDGRYDDEWQTEVAARSTLLPVFQRPIREADKIECPLLVVACDADGVIPPKPAYEVASKAPHGELFVIRGGHYSPYQEGIFDETVAAEVEFLERHLVAAATDGEPVPVSVSAGNGSS